MYRVIFLNKGRWIRAYDEMGNDVFRYINKAFKISDNIRSENPFVKIKVQKIASKGIVYNV
jgi:hypothetical protein